MKKIGRKCATVAPYSMLYRFLCNAMQRASQKAKKYGANAPQLRHIWPQAAPGAMRQHLFPLSIKDGEGARGSGPRQLRQPLQIRISPCPTGWHPETPRSTAQRVLEHLPARSGWHPQVHALLHAGTIAASDARRILRAPDLSSPTPTGLAFC